MIRRAETRESVFTIAGLYSRYAKATLGRIHAAAATPVRKTIS
jgi:hypothetical protein